MKISPDVLMPISQEERICDYMNNSYLIERVRKLFKCISDDKSLDDEDKKIVHSFVLDTINHFSEYVLATNNYVYTIQSIKELKLSNIIGQDEFERKLKNVDLSRRNKHNIAIDACNQLNRQCDLYGIPRICDIDTSNRVQVADFAAHFSMVTHGYAVNHNYTMDEILQEMEKDVNLLNSQNNIFERK